MLVMALNLNSLSEMPLSGIRPEKAMGLLIRYTITIRFLLL